MTTLHSYEHRSCKDALSNDLQQLRSEIMVTQTIPIQYFSEIQLDMMLRELFPNGGYTYRVGTLPTLSIFRI